MISLFLAGADRQNALVLMGANRAGQVRGLRRQTQPVRLPNGLVEEIIDLECRGAGIWDFITDLEVRLTLARDGQTPFYLWMQTAERGQPVGARVEQSRLELLGGGTADRARGFQGLRLHLTRQDWLAQEGVPLPLYNPNGSGIIDGLTLHNHFDAEHVNFVDVQAADIAGTQPAEAVLMLETGSSPARRLGRIVMAGGSSLWDVNGEFQHVLEGEDAAPGPDCSASQVLVDTSAGNAGYQTFQWTSVVEAHVLSWTVSGSQLAWLAGRGFRPAARLQSLPPVGVRWRWKIVEPDSGAVLDQSSQYLLDSTKVLQVLPAVFPPLHTSITPYSAFRLEAWLESTMVGTKQIDLDFVQLLPLENFVLCEPLGGLAQGQRLVLDWINNQFYSENDASGEKSMTHRVSGAPLVLRPGCNHRIYVLYEIEAGFPIDQSLKLRLSHGARWLQP